MGRNLERDLVEHDGLVTVDQYPVGQLGMHLPERIQTPPG